eukprot:518186-Pyramimonas_sp.AAC.1
MVRPGTTGSMRFRRATRACGCQGAFTKCCCVRTTSSISPPSESSPFALAPWRTTCSRARCSSLALGIGSVWWTACQRSRRRDDDADDDLTTGTTVGATVTP